MRQQEQTQTDLCCLVCDNISFGKRDDDQEEEGGEGEHVNGQGEDDTPEGVFKLFQFCEESFTFSGRK